MGGKQGPEVGVGEVEEYSSTYGSHSDKAYGIRVHGNGSGEGARSGSGPWAWLGVVGGMPPGGAASRSHASASTGRLLGLQVLLVGIMFW